MSASTRSSRNSAPSAAEEGAVDVRIRASAAAARRGGLSVAEVGWGDAVSLDMRGPRGQIPEEGLKLEQRCGENGRIPAGGGLERCGVCPERDADPADWATELYRELQ